MKDSNGIPLYHINAVQTMTLIIDPM